MSSSLIFFKDGSFNCTERVLDNQDDWVITQDKLDHYAKCGLRTISQIVTKGKRSDFEDTVLNMALLYSKAAFTKEPMEKLVHTLAALEVTLLRNSSEPVQQNIADRLAFFISDKLNERKKIAKNFKKVYGFRSDYLHHARLSDDIEIMSEFFSNVWVFYVLIVVNSHQFTDRIAFLDFIDDRKYR